MTYLGSSPADGPLGHGWHAPADVLDCFAREPAALDDVVASSVESHLVACGPCRARLAAASPLDLTASWDAVADRIDRPRSSRFEQLLERLGFGGGLSRLVGATPGLWLAGLVAIAGLAIAAALVSRTVDARGPFLALAPLVPLAAVAATFAPAADPAGEAGVATPLHGFGLALRRAAVVVGTTFALLGPAALAVPGVGLESAAWVVPALALVLGSLALGTWWRVEIAVSALALGWMAAIASMRLVEGRRFAFADSVLFDTSGQLVALALALLAAAVLAARSDRYATLEARS